MKVFFTVAAGLVASFAAARVARAGVPDIFAPADEPFDDTGQTPPFNPDAPVGEPEIEIGRYIRSKIGDGPERCFDRITGEFVELERCGDLGPFSDALTGALKLDVLEAGAAAGAGMLPLERATVGNTGIAGALDDATPVFAPMTSCCG